MPCNHMLQTAGAIQVVLNQKILNLRNNLLLKIIITLISIIKIITGIFIARSLKKSSMALFINKKYRVRAVHNVLLFNNRLKIEH